MTSTGEPYPQLTLFEADIPANHSASPAQETAQTTPDTFGPVSPTAFAYFDHDSRCWKTLQATFHWDLEMYKPTWPRSGTTQNGIAYQLQPSAPRTSVIAYSLSLHETMEWTPTLTFQAMWPTPTYGKLAGGSAAVNHIKAKHQAGQITEEEMKAMQAGNGGKLNPEWVEWLMGFPIGWTDLEASETP